MYLFVTSVYVHTINDRIDCTSLIFKYTVYLQLEVDQSIKETHKSGGSLQPRNAIINASYKLQADK